MKWLENILSHTIRFVFRISDAIFPWDPSECRENKNIRCPDWWEPVTDLVRSTIPEERQVWVESCNTASDLSFCIPKIWGRYQLTYQYFNKRLVDFIRLLSHFYSLDKDKAGKFPGERNRLQITLAQTLPAAIFYNGCLCLMLTTPETRSLYWKISLFGTVLGCVWMSFRSQA